MRLDSVWCERRDLNPYERLMVHKNLNLARLPISPLSRVSFFILPHRNWIVNYFLIIFESVSQSIPHIVIEAVSKYNTAVVIPGRNSGSAF